MCVCVCVGEADPQPVETTSPCFAQIGLCHTSLMSRRLVNTQSAFVITIGNLRYFDPKGGYIFLKVFKSVPRAPESMSPIK